MAKQLLLQVREDLPLREAVYYTIREAILLGKLEPDERLMEMHLARELGVSRTPVREALRHLADDGLVTMAPNRGAMVARISAGDLMEVLEVRLALEQLAVMKACRNITPGQLEHLKEAQRRFRTSLENDDRSGSATADEDFHGIIAQAAGNSTLRALLVQFRERLYRYRMESVKPDNYHKDLIRQHKEILEALEERDEERAQGAMRAHIRLQLEIIRGLLGAA